MNIFWLKISLIGLEYVSAPQIWSFSKSTWEIGPLDEEFSGENVIDILDDFWAQGL